MRMNLDQQLSDDVLRIIGVEFNIIKPGRLVTEMAMFVPNGTGLVIPRMYSSSRPMGGGGYQPIITFHSTIGDYTIGRNDYTCPW